MRAALVCSHALTVGLTAEEVLERIAAADGGDPLLEELESRGDPERLRSPRGTRRTLGPNDSRHGTTNGYTNYACRCERCVAAARAERLKRRR